MKKYFKTIFQDKELKEDSLQLLLSKYIDRFQEDLAAIRNSTRHYFKSLGFENKVMP